MLLARTWIPKFRYGVSKGKADTDTLFEGEIYDEVMSLKEPEFQCHAVQINRYQIGKWTHSDIHTDAGNEGDSRMVVLGDFEGGAFLIHEDGRAAPPRRIVDRWQWIRFFGHYDHGSEPVTGGIRFSVIIFRFADRAG